MAIPPKAEWGKLSVNELYGAKVDLQQLAATAERVSPMAAKEYLKAIQELDGIIAMKNALPEDVRNEDDEPVIVEVFDPVPRSSSSAFYR